jgi:arthrofactin-type cyclic lipopeptide synthetase C
MNAQIYILDARGRPVPLGVAGEIYIGGRGVAQGYSNRSELTAGRFLPDPFNGNPLDRMYRTGDLGRWRADGIIEYLGRNDDQIKIRGFRIELGEIEEQLVQHPLIKEAVVIAREDVPGEKYLAAYFTPRDQGETNVEALRTQLKTVLPEQMIPAAFVMLQRFPLTANGKLDRRGLPAPAIGAFSQQEYEAPRGAIEETLAGIWREVLHVERVGRRDNFFELGGHSLLGMKLIAKVAQILGTRPPIVTIFQYPTVQQMAQLVETLLSDDQRPSEPLPTEVNEGVI